MDALEPIAIVGLAVRFPGDAENVESFWDILCNKRSTLTEIPKDRFNVDAFWHPSGGRGGSVVQRKAHFLKQNIAAFDAGFFAMPPNEANSMDPQQRILLEVVYESLENAGLSIEDVSASKTACFVGAFTREYEGMMARDEENVSTYHATGNGMAMLANRISWFYNLQGPSLTLDTACSSSLTGLHLACQSLRNGESSMAILGGVNLFFNPDAMFPLSAMGFLSPDGQCYAFDHRANGYVRGEGFASVILQPLSGAIRDGRTIRAVVRSTGLNQDGHTPGITLPNGKSQEELIRNTYATAQLDMSLTRYFEAHGTGTPAGDPIEAGAIAAAFETSKRDSNNPLFIGAVKSNIGHLEGTSGLAGLIKTICVLETGLIPPNTAFEKPNPRIPAEAWKIKFPSKMTPWPCGGLRRASINSFGYGGSNAHAILDDAFNYLQLRVLHARHCTVASPPEITVQTTNHPDSLNNDSLDSKALQSFSKRLFVWSAADKNAASRIAATYGPYFRSLKDKAPNEDQLLNDLAYTLAERRGRFNWRTFAVASSITELANIVETDLPPQVRAGQSVKLGFVFTGQGAQWAGMGRELLLSSSAYQESIQAADKFFKSLGSSWSLIEELEKDQEHSRIDEPMISQPACTAIQTALVDLLAGWGVVPLRVVGHSSGEIAAAYCIGALDRESAWKAAYFRGLVSQKLRDSNTSRGGMMAAGIAEGEANHRIQKFDNGHLTVACINSPSNVTISGDASAVEALHRQLESEGVFARRLNVCIAYHSSHMRVVASDYASMLGNLRGSDSQTTGSAMFSSVTSKEVSPKALQLADYWVQNLISPVKFSEALVTLCTADLVSDAVSRNRLKVLHDQTKIDSIVEIGPHSALRSAIRQTLSVDSKFQSINYFSALTRDQSSVDSTLQLAGSLFARGHNITLDKINNQFQDAQSAAPTMLTGLPPYPWNRSDKFWFESRLSKDYRFRKHPRHDLLGAPVSDWNPSEPRWRHFLRISENPWIKDHKISNSVLYPAAGFLVMAIEASRQLADSDRKATGFRIRDIAFHSALTVPEGAEGIETMLYMRPHAHSSSLLSIMWNEFHVSSYSPRYGWKEHCRGMISVEYELDSNPVSGKQEQEELEASYVAHLEQTAQQCTDSMEASQMYEYFETIGLQYGPSFRTIKEVHYTIDKATCVLATPDLKQIMPQGHFHGHIIHPTTLDGVLQILFPAIGNGSDHLPEAMIPAFIGELWISSDNPTTPGHELTGFAMTRFNGPREAQGRAVMFDKATNKPLVVLEGLKSKAVTSSDFAVGGADAISFEERKLTGYQMQWKPDIELLTADQKIHFDNDPLDERPTPISSQVIHDLELLSLINISQVLQELADDEISQFQSHHQKYVQWMKFQLQRFENGEHEHQTTEWQILLRDPSTRESLTKRLESSCADGRVMSRIGPEIVAILRQKSDALELMMRDDLLFDLYQNGIGNEVLRTKLASYVELLSFKKPQMNILEIGAGTGGTSLTTLRTLSNDGFFKLSSYTYTDISAGFFEEAKTTFAQWGDKMIFQVLDVEKDPVEQDYEVGKYDLVIASNVLHATSNLQKSIKNVHKLLKPGGKLILFEICHPLLRNALSFGLLPGWWRFEESYRQWGPTITEPEWDRLLRDSGFNGIDFALRDYDDPKDHHVSFLVSTADGVSNRQETTSDVVIVTSSTNPQTQLVAQLQNQLHASGYGLASTASFGSLTHGTISRKALLFVADLARPVLPGIENETFSMLQMMLTSAASVLWLSPGSTLAGSAPDSGLIVGLGRVVRAERNGFKFITLQLSEQPQGDFMMRTQCLAGVLRVFNESASRSQGAMGESEYSEKDGTIYINRLVQAPQFNDVMSATYSARKARLQPFGGDRDIPQQALKLEISAPGLLSTLRFVEDEMYHETLPDSSIEIEVTAVGLNFRDVMIAMGQLSDTYLGDECAGVIRRVGSAVKSFQVGDRVFGVAHGSLRTYYRDEARLFQKIPEGMSFESAAALPLVYCTAYYGLMYRAGLQRGQSVLIHAAAGGVGQAAIVLAKRVGAEVFVTVGTTDKKDFVQQEYGISEDHIFYSRDLSFAKGVRRMTHGRGVDVVLNSLSGEALRLSWQCVAPFGTFVELGRRDIDAHSRLDLDPFIKNVTFTSVNYAILLDINKPLASKLFSEVVELASQDEISPAKELTVYPYSQLEDAFRNLQGGKHIGKIILKSSQEDLVNVIPQVPEPARLNPQASYIVAGGLGGLGRSMIRRLVKLDVRHLILVSRSGAASEPAKATVEELRSSGVKVKVYSCDISDKASLSAVLEDVKGKMPPIRGCIQSAMVLRDSMFESMDAADFQAAIRPKTEGTWNLHSLLPRDLDFFVMLASASGVTGTRGQANYAAGNTYQDALAYHRVSQGQHAIAIDLGLVLSIGYVAEHHTETADYLKEWGFMGIREAEFLTMIEYAIDPANAPSMSTPCQVTAGIESAALMRQKGLEEPYYMREPLFSHLRAMESITSERTEAEYSQRILGLLQAAESLEVAVAVICEALVSKLSKVLSYAEEEIDASKPLHAYGVDSLVAVVIRYWLMRELAADLAVFDIMASPSITALSSIVAEKSKHIDSARWESN